MFFWFASAAIVGVLFGSWYLYCRYCSRRRASIIRDRLELALAGQGRVTEIHWKAPRHFSLLLKLSSSIFRRARIHVHFKPRELPPLWLWSILKKFEETLTFEADFDIPPAFSLDVHSYQTFARTNKGDGAEFEGWEFAQSAPFVLSTRDNWTEEITHVFSSLLSQRRYLSMITFSPKSPHFSTTMPLEAVAERHVAKQTLEMIKEVALAPQTRGPGRN